MLEPCRRLLDAAEEMVEWGMIDEGVERMVRLRRCAQAGACADWNDCRGRVESAWADKGSSARVTAQTRPTSLVAVQ